MHASILSTDDLAARWGCSRNTITERWRLGEMPAPFNASAQRGFRWHIDVIEAYEHGEWKPPSAASVAFGLMAS